MREERYQAVDVPAFSRVTELVLSPAAAVRLWDAGRDTIVERTGAAGTVTCGPRYRALVQRLFVHRERVDVTSAIQRPGALGLVALVDALAYGGLVSVRHRCADPPRSPESPAPASRHSGAAAACTQHSTQIFDMARIALLLDAGRGTPAAIPEPRQGPAGRGS